MKHFKQSSRHNLRIQIAMVIVSVTLLSGCQPSLSFEQQYSLTSAEVITLPIDAVGREQTIQVTANASEEANFKVHIFLKKDEDQAERSIATGAATDLILAASETGAQAILSATIPANEASIVRVSAEGNPVTVNVKIHN